MTMKENQGSMIYDSDCFIETNSFDFGSKETYEFKDSRRESGISVDSLAFDKIDKDLKQRISGHECSMTVEAELDCELPEMEICYKDTNHQAVKDICVDEGRSETYKNLIEYRKDGESRHIFTKSVDNSSHCKTEDGVELVLFISGELEPSLLDNPWKETEANYSPTSKNGIGSSEKESLQESELPIQEFGTRSFLRSFLHTLDEVKNPTQPFDQVPNEKPQADVRATSPLAVNLDEISDSRQVQYTNCNRDPGMSGKNMNNENVLKQFPEHKEVKFRNLSAEQTDDASIVNQLQYDEGETSFYTDNFITYSGPMPFSGSLSHRSDGSTTSGKSFAFPVLRHEWNSSPVRMAKGDKRRLWKHNDWKSQFLCCKF